MWRKSSGIASRSNFCLQGGLGEKGNVPGFSWTIHRPKGFDCFLMLLQSIWGTRCGLGIRYLNASLVI